MIVAYSPKRSHLAKKLPMLAEYQDVCIEQSPEIMKKIPMEIKDFGRNSFVIWTTGLKERLAEKEKKMTDRKHCAGCHDNCYNSPSTSGSADGICWMRKTGKLVWRIPIGLWESPPYKGKKKIRVPSCWHGSGSNKTIMVKPESITPDGYWKWL